MVYGMVTSTLKKSLQNIVNRIVSQEISKIVAVQNDILAAQWLAPLSNSYTPWTNSAMNPSGLVAVLNDISICSRQCVVECGGGISTFYIARLLKELNKGHLYTIDHDKSWVDFLRNKIKTEKLESFATIIFAPLVPVELSLDENSWYCPQSIDEELVGKEIDMLLVDGPLAYKKEIMHSRYPAVPHLQKYFAKDYTIVLDDCNRDGEKAILEEWQNILNIEFEIRSLHGNIGVGRSNSTFNI